jgi:ferredoxin-type protein NapF
MHPIRSYKRTRLVLGLAVLLIATLALADFRELLPLRAGHWITAVQFVPASVALATGALFSGVATLAILLGTLLFGRVYCSVLCPLGLFQDLVSRLSRRLRRTKRPLPFAKRQTPLRQAFLWATVAGVLVGWAGFALSLLDPYSNYGRIASAVFRPLVAAANNAVVGTANAIGIDSLYRVDLPWPGIGAVAAPAAFLTLVIVLSALRGRLYCNSICPVGTLLGWVSRYAAFRIEIDKDKCTKCASCIKVCKAQCIDLRKGEIDFDRCVACYNCIGTCDDHGVGYRFKWLRKKPAPAPASKEKSRASEPAVKNPERRALFGRTASALALSTCLPLLSKADETEGQQGGPQAKDDPGAHTGGKGTNRSVGVSPPGSASVDRFLERCTACHLCISVCPSHVLQPALLEYGIKGFMKPRLDFVANFCDFDCTRCADVCPDGAITRLPVAEKQLEQIGIAHFHKKRCIVFAQGTDCAACSEHCPTKAVYTVPFGDNLRLPEVKEELCIGCGACEHACPVKPEKAITVTGLRVHGKAVRLVEKSTAKPAASGNDFPF